MKPSISIDSLDKLLLISLPCFPLVENPLTCLEKLSNIKENLKEGKKLTKKQLLETRDYLNNLKMINL